MTTLSTRIEAAGPEDQRALLVEAKAMLSPSDFSDFRWDDLIYTHAFLSASEMLVPSDCVWSVSCNDEYPGKFRGTVMPLSAPDATVWASTPALGPPSRHHPRPRGYPAHRNFFQTEKAHG